jgi:plasmid stabilization system protein ParE
VRYEVVRSEDADRDLQTVFNHLLESYAGFGESRDDAIDRAASRLQRIHRAMEGLGRAPHQGTLQPRLTPGLRHVTKDRAIFYFTVDEEARRVTVLAIFFGGQDHQRAMLKRLMGGV